MTSLVITVDDQVLQRASLRALAQGTSVNTVLAEFLDSWSKEPSRADAIADLVRLAESAGASSGSAGRTWSREDLHGR